MLLKRRWTKAVRRGAKRSPGIRADKSARAEVENVGRWWAASGGPRCTAREPSQSDCDCLSTKPQTARLSHHSIKRHDVRLYAGGGSPCLNGQIALETQPYDDIERHSRVVIKTTRIRLSDYSSERIFRDYITERCTLKLKKRRMPE